MINSKFRNKFVDFFRSLSGYLASLYYLPRGGLLDLLLTDELRKRAYTTTFSSFISGMDSASIDFISSSLSFTASGSWRGFFFLGFLPTNVNTITMIISIS